MYQVLVVLVLCVGRLASSAESSVEESVEERNPDQDLTTPEIIRRHGYPSEAHVIVTEDGYLLTLHRIPFGRKKSPRGDARKVAFLQHGLLASSADWILTGPDKSLAYILADNGYDVWLGNARGNTYSRAHVELSHEDPKFWNFSWYEMGNYDLPAALDYISDRFEPKALFYIGHSMGTTMFFAMTSTKPEYGLKVTAMFALAPVAYMNDIKSPIRLLAPWANDIEFVSRYLGNGAFLPNNKIINFLLKYGCEVVAWEMEICENLIFILFGFDRSQFDMAMLPLILSHAPAGTSTKNLLHYAQEVNSGKFQQFDYGKTKNLEIYGTKTPPAYNLSLITTPISLHYADNDWLASMRNIQRLYDQLPRKIGKFLIKYKGFNHIDFLWGKDAKTLVYNQILDMLREL